MSLQLSHAFANINFYCSFNDQPQILMAACANTRCFRFTLKANVLLQTILQCCDTILQY